MDSPAVGQAGPKHRRCPQHVPPRHLPPARRLGHGPGHPPRLPQPSTTPSSIPGTSIRTPTAATETPTAIKRKRCAMTYPSRISQLPRTRDHWARKATAAPTTPLLASGQSGRSGRHPCSGSRPPDRPQNTWRSRPLPWSPGWLPWRRCSPAAA